MRRLFQLFFSDSGQKIWLGILLLSPIALWLLPADFFDGDGLILCPSRLFFGIECYGCGITRAVMHMHHFEVDEAVYYNMLVLIVYPALIAVWFYWVFKAYKSVFKPKGATLTPHSSPE